MVSGQLDRVLRGLSIPIQGVSIGDVNDRSTWVINYDDAATGSQRELGEATRLAFDPKDPEVIAAEEVVKAQAQVTPELRAFYLWWFRKTNRRDPTDQERAADTLALIQAFKDVG